MKTSQSGFGILQVLVVLAIVGALTVGTAQLMFKMSNDAANTKTQTGRDSLTSALLATLSEQSLCGQRLTGNREFNASLAALPGGPIPGSTNPRRMNLVFKLDNPDAPMIGTPYPTASGTYFPQFNLYVGAIYFANAKTLPAPNNVELAPSNPNLKGKKIYRGEVWATISKPGPDGKIGGALADRRIADNLYIWTDGTTIAGCGIMKTAEQLCVDDLGGKYLSGAVNPCTHIPYPCPVSGNYFLGYDQAGKPLCVASAINCKNAGETIVSDGKGGVLCAPVP